ncbi:hypothetical protein SUDANB121_03593 [Nocardiopsis dassonvillei]|uniref:hypothetical protein n=1 Tax=Nocardiopsis dassonvillei TaxID=2014 RepID=UPI003F54DE7A
MLDERVLALAGAAVLVLALQGLLHVFMAGRRVHLPEGRRLQDLPESSDDREILDAYATDLLERRRALSEGAVPVPGPKASLSVRARPSAPLPRAWSGAWAWAGLILLIGVCALAGW